MNEIKLGQGATWDAVWEKIKAERDGNIWPVDAVFNNKEFFRLGWMSCIAYAPEEPTTEQSSAVGEAGDIREQLASLCHEQWSGWMKYLFSKCSIIEIENDQREALIPPWAFERWHRQMETPYRNLSEKEKDSDREEADKFIALLNLPRLQAIEKAAREIAEEIRLYGPPPQPRKGARSE